MAIAEFEIPIRQIFDLLNRFDAARSYSLESPVIRPALQRLESEAWEVDRNRVGQVDIDERVGAVIASAGHG